MNKFIVTTHLSDIIDASNNEPVIIFKYSSECGTSDILAEKIKDAIEKNIIDKKVYLVTVQKLKSLSQKIEEMFQIKHESPQIIILNKGKVTYTEHHKNIKIEDFKYQ